jgi:hypothetical protein
MIWHAGAVAGGMGYRRGVPLGQRPVETGAPAPTTVASSAARRPSTGPTPPEERLPTARRHCWVRGVDGAPGPHPGLLVEWRRRGTGQWEALVVYAVEDRGAVTLVQQWLASALVSPSR